MRSFAKFLLTSASLFLPLAACGQTTETQRNINGIENAQPAVVRGKAFSARIISWERGPSVSEDTSPESLSKCIIEITTPDGQIPQMLTITKVYPYMKMHGHGAPSGQITRSLDGNKLTIDNIMFTMSGPWELHVVATVDGQTEDIALAVVVP